MSRHHTVPRWLSTAFSLLTIFLLTASAFAITAPGEKNPQQPMLCDTPGDTAILGDVTTRFGETVAVPLYVGSDECIINFRYEFILPDAVDFVSVDAGTWTGGFDDPIFDPVSRTLVIEHSTGGTCMTPDLNDVFLTLNLTTHCKSVHNQVAGITWAPYNSFNPNIYLGHSSCNRDPLESMTDGSVTIEAIRIDFDISDETALIGDIVTVTVTCDNDYLFDGFSQLLQWDVDVLEPIFPVEVIETPRAPASALTAAYYDSPAIRVSGSKSDGFGESAIDGQALYQLNFRVISAVDDVNGAIWFMGGSTLTALDCGQDLAAMTPPVDYYTSGSVTVPAYRAVVYPGEAVWGTGSNCTFEVPVYLKNNFPVNGLQFAIRFGTDQNCKLDAIDFIGSNGFPISWAGENLCDGSVPYMKLESVGSMTIDPRADSVEIGRIVFKNSDLQSTGYTEVLELQPPCPYSDFPVWVYTNDDVRTTTFYNLGDPQLTGSTGSVEVSAPQVTVRIPGGQASNCKFGVDCEYWVDRPLLISTNTDLDSVWFTIDWDNTLFCMTVSGLPQGSTVFGNSTSGSVRIRILNIGTNPNERSFGTVRFTNGQYTDQSGVHSVINVGAQESCTHQSVAASGSGGSCWMYALPVSHVSCLAVSNNGNTFKSTAVPDRFELIQNHPNPFNASTIIEFTLAEAAHTRLEIYNIMGQRIVTLMDDFTEAGAYSIRWDGRTSNGNVAATGVYLYRLASGNMVDTKKMLLLK